jgi:beta-phosphoglucomutase-like phosphatase (HAD superfamily)
VNGTPIRNLQKLLKKIGMKLTQPAEGKRYGKNRGRDRKYLLERHSSHQDAIFRNWEAQLSSPAVEIAA